MTKSCTRDTSVSGIHEWPCVQQMLFGCHLGVPWELLTGVLWFADVSFPFPLSHWELMKDHIHFIGPFNCQVTCCFSAYIWEHEKLPPHGVRGQLGLFTARVGMWSAESLRGSLSIFSFCFFQLFPFPISRICLFSPSANPSPHPAFSSTLPPCPFRPGAQLHFLTVCTGESRQ